MTTETTFRASCCLAPNPDAIRFTRRPDGKIGIDATKTIAGGIQTFFLALSDADTASLASFLQTHITEKAIAVEAAQRRAALEQAKADAEEAMAAASFEVATAQEKLRASSAEHSQVSALLEALP